MVKQICCNSYVLEDPIVLDGIMAVEEIGKGGKISGNIAGGMGVQSYIPERFHRKTIDLDFSTLWQGSLDEFRDMIYPLRHSLESKGYETSLVKRNYTFDYHISKGDESFIIQHKRDSKTHFGKLKHTLERELSNRRRLSNGGISYNVLSPEDLVVHKINRMRIFGSKYDANKPRSNSIKVLYNNIIDSRTSLVSHFENASPEEIAEFRLLCDTFDVKCLAKYVQLDKSYFNEIVRECSEDWGLNCSEMNKDLDNLQIQLK